MEQSTWGLPGLNFCRTGRLDSHPPGLPRPKRKQKRGGFSKQSVNPERGEAYADTAEFLAEKRNFWRNLLLHFGGVVAHCVNFQP